VEIKYPVFVAVGTLKLLIDFVDWIVDADEI
jgi:hypothetical protein